MRKKGKSISFDVMVKFFLHKFEIPTKKDINRLHNRLDNLEQLIIDSVSGGLPGKVAQKLQKTRTRQKTATFKVLEVIQENPDGLMISEIQTLTGFESKKLRNIIYRLNNLGKIKRKRRGVYIPA